MREWDLDDRRIYAGSIPTTRPSMAALPLHLPDAPLAGKPIRWMLRRALSEMMPAASLEPPPQCPEVLGGLARRGADVARPPWWDSSSAASRNVEAEFARPPVPTTICGERRTCWSPRRSGEDASLLPLR